MTTWQRHPDGAWSIDLPIALRSGNERVVNGRHKATGAIYRRARDKAARDLRIVAMGVGAPTRLALYDSPPRREVLFTRLMGKGQRSWDCDNVIAALKGIRDAMQATVKGLNGSTLPGAGLIVDDSARWAEFPKPLQERSVDGSPGLRIRIRDLEETP